MIAWNGSTESARTIAFGMPFLRAAERVEVLTVKGHTVPGPSGVEVAAHLARHGIAATSRTLEPDERPAGEIILDEAGDFGADLILKGAFTRSRLRQIVFGGTTQHILDYAEDSGAVGALMAQRHGGRDLLHGLIGLDRG